MSSLWDSFAQKIHSGNIMIDEMVELIEFIKEFDNVNDNIISHTMITRLKNLTNFDFSDWNMFSIYMQTGSVHRVILEYFISELHTFDHENEQVLMYSFTKDKHYWVKHHTFRNWMGTFKNGKWNYSKQYNKIQKERLIA